ncbi:MAG: LLM class F420-dependent oxidoreductase [Solirubrobacteraceae bacterium]
MSREIGVALPFWLDRPDGEALEIALAAERVGIRDLWVGEMATFDAFALATAIGMRATRARLRIGPLAIGVRSPVSLALGVRSVATLTGHPVGVVLGASSPAIVRGWHDRPWEDLAPRMSETIRALRAILDGARVSFDGRHVRTHGFKLRAALHGTQVTVAAFGPALTRIAAREADEVVLNLVSVEHVARVRAQLDRHARTAGRQPPRLAVWVPAALDPGARARAQLSAQLAVYLSPPGYGEMFSSLGFDSLVQRARSGASRSELAAAVPDALLVQVGALGATREVLARVNAYHDAGADHVALVPCTAEDAGATAVLQAVSSQSFD